MSRLSRYTGRLTNHAQVLLCIARDPGIRLRDIADRVGITQRTAFPTSLERTVGVLALLAGAELRPPASPDATCRLASAA